MPRPQSRYIRPTTADTAPRPPIMIELPAIEAVGVPPNAMAGQMKRQRRRQPLVARRKSLRRLLDRPEGAGLALPDAVELVDPSRHLLVDRRAAERRQKGAVQHAKTRHLLRVGPGIGERDHSAQRMTDNGGILQLREARSSG